MSAWTVIAHTEVGSGGAANITFLNVGNIPATYTDLVILCSLRSTQASSVEQIRLTINTSTANFTKRFLQGNGSAADTFSGSDSQTGYASSGNNTASTFGNAMIYIPNYAGSTAKSISADVVTENNATEAFQVIHAGLWNITDAITKIAISTQNGNLAQYSSATLYGITKGSSGGVVVS
jgi:hypothetical protein